MELLELSLVGGATRGRSSIFDSNPSMAPLFFCGSFHQSVPDVQREIRGRGISNVGNVAVRIFLSTMCGACHVKAISKRSNLNAMCSLVVSSDTTCETTTYPKSFCEWLAGVIDGDGHIGVSNGYPRLVLTVGLEDRPLLEYLTGQLKCGNIYSVKGAAAICYIIRNRLGMIQVIHCINGIIRNSVRLPQLRRVCEVLNIPFQAPIELTAQSNWFAGFFDADGTVGIHGLPKRAPWISISVSNKFESDLAPLQFFFGGRVYYNKSHNGHEWVVSSRKESSFKYGTNQFSSLALFPRELESPKVYNLKGQE